MSDRVVLDGDMSLTNPLDGDALINAQIDGQGGVYNRYNWRGYSAYEIAVQHGYTGTEEEWLASLHGADGGTGQQGPQGEQGLTGPTGPQGPKGDTGDKGEQGDDYVLTAQDKQNIANLIPRPEAEVIADITTSEDLASVVIDTDIDGNPFSLRKAKIMCTLTASTTGAATYIASHFFGNDADEQERELSFPTLTMYSATKSFQTYEFETEGGLYFVRAWRSGGFGNSTSTIYTIAQNYMVKEMHGFSLLKYNASSSLIPKGTRIVIWGIRA